MSVFHLLCCQFIRLIRNETMQSSLKRFVLLLLLAIVAL